MTTRGVRRLKEYLADGEEVARMSATRRIAAMAPLLSAKLRRQSTTTHESNTTQEQQQQNEVKDNVKARSTTTTVVPTTPVSEAVVTYLRQHHDCGASNELSHTQLRLVDILAGNSNNNLQTTTNTVGGENDASTNAQSGGNEMESGGVVRVRRVHLPSVRAIVDSLGIASLERHHRYSLSGTTTAAVNAGLMEGGVLFVLAEDAALAEELRRELVTRYALNVMLLADHDVPRFPSWPAVTTTANNNNNGNESERSSVATVATKKASRSAATAASRKRARSTRRGGNNDEEEEGTQQGKSNADDDNSNRVAVTATTPSSAQDSHTSGGGGDAASDAASVVIATAAGFLAVDRRSAVWKFIGAYAIVLRTASPHESALLQQLHIKRTSNKNSKLISLSSDAVSQSTAAMSMAARLAAQRWACLGHCPLACVIATHRAMLVEPALDWLLTLQPISSSSSSKSGAVQGRDVAAVAQSQSTKDDTHEQPAEGTVKKKKKKGETIVPVMRDPVTLYHATAEGIERFQFLFGLICGLAPHRGLLVHCASKACCVFLRHALYALADELPSHVRVLHDVDDEEGTREGGEVLSEAAKRELCATFDATVLTTTNNNSEEGDEAVVTKTSAVLLSCCGLVPREGDIFLQYDLLLDLPSFTQFVSDVLTPGAYRHQTLYAPARQSKTDSTNGNNEDDDALLVRRVTQTRSRKRSTSPIPLTASASSSAAGHTVRATSPTPRQDNTTSQQHIAEVSRTPRTATKYSIILLLFRPCELPKALHCLALTTARHALRLVPLPQPPSRLRYAHIASKLRSLHRQTFEFARLSYEAYKATMALYASMRGSGVYDCTKVNLQKVAEEYGYVNTVPVLDLRLRDTVFRPKEDYYKAARQKQAHESSAYRRFAAERIAPEPTEAHVVDETHTTHKPVRRRRRRHY